MTSPELIEKAALGLFVARYDRQPVPESFDDGRLNDCREDAHAVLAAVADDLSRALAEATDALAVARKQEASQTRAVATAWKVADRLRAELAEVKAKAEGAACCCETSPPEFGGPIPERDCPLHGEPAYHRGMVEGAQQVYAAVEEATDGCQPGECDYCDGNRGSTRAAREAVARIEKKQ